VPGAGFTFSTPDSLAVGSSAERPTADSDELLVRVLHPIIKRLVNKQTVISNGFDKVITRPQQMSVEELSIFDRRNGFDNSRAADMKHAQERMSQFKFSDLVV